MFFANSAALISTKAAGPRTSRKLYSFRSPSIRPASNLNRRPSPLLGSVGGLSSARPPARPQGKGASPGWSGPRDPPRLACCSGQAKHTRAMSNLPGFVRPPRSAKSGAAGRSTSFWRGTPIELLPSNGQGQTSGIWIQRLRAEAHLHGGDLHARGSWPNWGRTLDVRCLADPAVGP